MDGQNSAAPVIIKRKKVVAGGGHHGGAWKVAYADFVTAMMAFFMLMWLLNATTEKQRKGIADYFSPTIPVTRISGGGDGSFGGDSVFSEEALPQSGTGATDRHTSAQDKAKGDTGVDAASDAEKAAEEATLREVEKALKGRSGESMVMEEILRHVVTRVTDEGLVIELFDLEGSPLFTGDKAEPSEVARTLAQMIADTFAVVRNQIAVNGHVRAYPVVLINNPVWDLSTARAQAFRDLMETAGIPPAQMQRVSGFADRKPAVENPMATRNNRLEIILLRKNR